MLHRFARLAPVLFCAVAVASLAGAEMYRCVDESGRTIFTSDPGVCPGQEPHTPKGQVQIGGGASPPARASARIGASRGGAVVPGADDGFEAMWRRKRGEAEHELEQASSELVRFEAFAKGCNRGVTWLAKDDSGLRNPVPCTDILARHEQIASRVAALRAYLDEGLAEECRRAGCLPGWIR